MIIRRQQLVLNRHFDFTLHESCILNLSITVFKTPRVEHFTISRLLNLSLPIPLTVTERIRMNPARSGQVD